MKFILVIEDTTKGIRCLASYQPNDVADSMDKSIAAKVVANLSQTLKHQETLGMLYVEKE